ncbi:MAG: LamG domain-containing protein, partial [Phycisphaerales bacterium]
MYTRVFLMASLVFVWCKASYGDLVAHWDLEEGSGATTAAAVGSPAADGTFVGATWSTTELSPAEGTTAAAFFNSNNSDRIETNLTGIAGQAARSVAAWVKADPTQNNNAVMVGWGVNNPAERWSFRLNDNAGNGPLWALRLEIQGSRIVATTPINDGQWHHVAVTHVEGALIDDVLFYLDGEPDQVTGSSGGGQMNTAASNVVIGNSGHSVGGYGFDGAIDDVRIYDHVLSPAEIRRLASRPKAYGPSPADGALHEATWANLSWTPGDSAVSHDVYVGENLTDVDEGLANTYQGNQTTTSLVLGFPGFPIPGGLVPGTTYYWRIDEVNDADPNSPWRGDVWSFTVPPKKAYNPSPSDGLEFVTPGATLSWTPGFGTKLNYVYFGNDSDAVSNAEGALAQADTTYVPGVLELDTTYYWRVDEFDGAVTHKGDIWSFSTLPVIETTSDPSLVAWWTLDEGLGDTAVDWSGHGNHGALVGEPLWTQGYDGSALDIGGVSGNRVEMIDYEGVLGTQNRTVTAWIRTMDNGDFISWGQNVNTQKWISRLNATAGNGNLGALRTECSGGYIIASTDLRDGRWHHVASVLESAGLPTIDDITLYVDGVPEDISGSQAVDVNTVGGRNVWIGDGHHDRPFPGLIDDVRIYDRALTVDEIGLVMRIDPLLAWSPHPMNAATPDIDNALPLTWTRGDSASSHEVYFGLDKDTVTGADTSDATGIYRGSQTGTSFSPAEGVEWGGGPYYWRIDENNSDGTVTKGRVWSFTVADFILVDDFESYTDDDGNNEAIWQTWVDGFDVPTNGAQAGYLVPPYAEQTIVHGGLQSMPLLYDNTAGVRNSEVVLPLTAPRDWTKHGVEVLSLWYRGYPPSVGSFVEGPVGTFTMTGSGADIWGTSDEFHFAYKTLTGPGTIVARVNSIQNTHNWAKAGVMIRETLDADSKYSFALVSAASGVAA